jgi:hypothetical protein
MGLLLLNVKRLYSKVRDLLRIAAPTDDRGFEGPSTATMVAKFKIVNHVDSRGEILFLANLRGSHLRVFGKFFALVNGRIDAERTRGEKDILANEVLDIECKSRRLSGKITF